jgi:hypothetical protein
MEDRFSLPDLLDGAVNAFSPIRRTVEASMSALGFPTEERAGYYRRRQHCWLQDLLRRTRRVSVSS